MIELSVSTGLPIVADPEGERLILPEDFAPTTYRKQGCTERRFGTGARLARLRFADRPMSKPLPISRRRSKHL